MGAQVPVDQLAASEMALHQQLAAQGRLPGGSPVACGRHLSACEVMPPSMARLMASLAGVRGGQGMPAGMQRPGPLSRVAVPRSCTKLVRVLFRRYTVSHHGAAAWSATGAGAAGGVCGSARWDAEDGRSACFRPSELEQQLPARVCAAHGTVSAGSLGLRPSMQPGL